MAAEPTRIRTKAEEALAAHFAALAGDDPMRAIRTTAFDAFIEKGLPHRRVEDWKYTDLRTLMREAPGPAAPANPAAAEAALARADVFADIDRARLVFVNGQFVPALSDMSGLEETVDFASLGGFLANGGAMLDQSVVEPEESPVMALNLAFVQDGAMIRVRDGAKVPRPLEIVTIFAGEEPGLQTLRNQMVVGVGAEVTILNTYSGPDGVAYHTNVVDEIRVGPGAKVRWIKAQEEGSDAIHLALTVPRIDGDAVFDPFLFAAGSRLARAELRVAFDGEDSSAGIRGTTIARDKQHLDTTLLVEHLVPGCTSTELFKSAIDGEAGGVFQGKILVAPGAQKTDAQMMSQALLLSERAEFANKPELEIFADDVTCAHGATCGQIDETMLFFMRARGIDREEAERMLVQAFLAEAIEQIGDEAVQDALEARTRRWLGMDAEVR
jgi:Fe-S cluster assembly protein SufD